MSRDYDWNDLKIMLAVVRTGTTLQASRLLHLSQSTVARRIMALEAALGADLFVKRPSGYEPTECGQKLIALAERAEAAAAEIATLTDAEQRALMGVVRVTTNPTLAIVVMDRALLDIRAAHPMLRIEMLATNALLDLGRGEADIALRAGQRPMTPDLFGRKIADDPWAVICSKGYAARHGVPEDIAMLKAHRHFVSITGVVDSPLADWIEDNVPPENIGLRRESIEGIFNSVSNGLGIGLLPGSVALADPDLVRCFIPAIPITSEIWLLTHERLRHDRRIRAVFDLLSAWLVANLVPTP